MLAITEKWNRVVHGYTNPPDTLRKNNIMETMNFCILINQDNEILQWFLNAIDECNMILRMRFVRGVHTRNLKVNVIKSTYKYNGRLFVIINKSFLHFIKKCKNYYKNKINHYKKNIFHRNIYGKFPLFKYPRASKY